jgi:hypothetical protein
MHASGDYAIAHEGTKRNKQPLDLVHRREAERPNQIWQADSADNPPPLAGQGLTHMVLPPPPFA